MRTAAFLRNVPLLAGLSDELLDRVNSSGEVLLSHTVLHERFVLRLAIGNYSTTRDHVRRAWEIIQENA